MTIDVFDMIKHRVANSGDPDSLLAAIWKRILIDYRFDEAMLTERVTRYAEGIDFLPERKRLQLRGNMLVDVNRHTMTWYTFTKNLRILNATELRMSMHCHHLRRTSDQVLTCALTDDYLMKEEKPDNNTPNEIALFFRGMCDNLGLDIEMFDILLDLYMARNGLIAASPQEKLSLKSYIRKEFRAPRMSWATLMKAFNFLCVQRVELIARLSYGYKEDTTHHYHFQLDKLDNLFNYKESLDGVL